MIVAKQPIVDDHWKKREREENDRARYLLKQQKISKKEYTKILTVQCILAHYPISSSLVAWLYKCSAYLLFFLRLNLNASFIKTIFFSSFNLLIHLNLPRARAVGSLLLHIVNKLSNLKYAEIKSHFSGFLYLVLDVTLFSTLLRTRIFFSFFSDFFSSI